MQFKTKSEHIAHGFIQSYIGPDHKVIDMRTFFDALVAALRAAHNEGLVKSEPRTQADIAPRRLLQR
jgi:hypothetical protein